MQELVLGSTLGEKQTPPSNIGRRNTESLRRVAGITHHDTRLVDVQTEREVVALVGRGRLSVLNAVHNNIHATAAQVRVTLPLGRKTGTRIQPTAFANTLAIAPAKPIAAVWRTSTVLVAKVGVVHAAAVLVICACALMIAWNVFMPQVISLLASENGWHVHGPHRRTPFARGLGLALHSRLCLTMVSNYLSNLPTRTTCDKRRH
mmetsp:Transcript_21558/g.51072  ORF Transcript_21558/g.51072 Transcript_21558/m.51072 type:complete len:205 (+) Transcript_21558:390-1004(+)